MKSHRKYMRKDIQSKADIKWIFKSDNGAYREVEELVKILSHIWMSALTREEPVSTGMLEQIVTCNPIEQSITLRII